MSCSVIDYIWKQVLSFYLCWLAIANCYHTVPFHTLAYMVVLTSSTMCTRVHYVHTCVIWSFPIIQYDWGSSRLTPFHKKIIIINQPHNTFMAPRQYWWFGGLNLCCLINKISMVTVYFHLGFGYDDIFCLHWFMWNK